MDGEPWSDPEVWDLIAGGQARAVHHIESPAMIGLSRMCQVRDIDTLIAVVSVIRPGAANEHKKVRFTRRHQGLEPVTYPHPSLEEVLADTHGLVVYEEHVLQICERFAGLDPGRADLLRRALGKQDSGRIALLKQDFEVAARQRGRGEAETAEVWELVAGFAGYAFCKAHSTAYGVEAYQAAWLKRYHPVEFMASVLTHGKGFYDPLVYVLECHRLGIRMLPPVVNDPGPGFAPRAEDGGPGTGAIRIPAMRTAGLTDETLDRWGRERGRFTGVVDFRRRVRPEDAEMEALLRVGAFDEFGQLRTAQMWEWHQVRQQGGVDERGQGWLFASDEEVRTPGIPLSEPTRLERLRWEAELLGFTASGHPLELFPNIAWETYCPVAALGEHVGRDVVTCGLVIQQRSHHQVTGEPMEFLTLADWTGMVETELFAATYRRYGLATVRYPVLEVEARVEPFENGCGHTLRVLRAGKPRTRRDGSPGH